MSILVTGKEEDMLLAGYVIGYFYGRAFFVQGHKMRVDVVHVGSIEYVVLLLFYPRSCPDCFSMAILVMLFCRTAFAIIKILVAKTLQNNREKTHKMLVFLIPGNLRHVNGQRTQPSRI